MKNLKRTITEFNDVLISKLVKGEYTIIHADKWDVKVCIDDEFKFPIWVASGKACLRIGMVQNLGGFFRDFTPEEKQAIWDLLYPAYQLFLEQKTASEKEKEIERLQAELDKLKSK